MSNKKSALLVIVLAALLVPLTAYVAQQDSAALIGSLAGGSAQSQLYMWPSSGALEKNKPVVMELRLDTGQETARRAEVVVSFDTDYFENQSLPLPGSIFRRYYGQNLDRANGVVSLGAEGEFRGAGVFLKLKLMPKKVGFTKIKLQEVSVNGEQLGRSNFSYTIY